MSINDLIHTNAHNAFEQGKKAENERILQLLESRLLMAKDETAGLTAMRVAVDRKSAIAVTEALIYAIKGEQK